MADAAFIPLTAAYKGAEKSAATKPATQSSSFQPVALPVASKTPAPCAEHGGPKVEVDRDGTRITRIRITCKCGEVIELACDY